MEAKKPKIALVHDHLAQAGGAEQVLRVFKEIYPEAPIFTLIFDKKNTNHWFGQYSKDIKTSFLQKMPFGISRYQWWLWAMPAAVEGFDLMDYDIVISSSSSFAKGVLTSQFAHHICYCHTPTRFLWSDAHSYIQELQVPSIVKGLLPFELKRLRLWDRMAAERVDLFLANSNIVRDRIRKYYGRASEVIYPPVETDKFFISPYEKKFFLAGGRLVPYKRVDLVVRAFARLGIPLKVFGTGPEMAKLQKITESEGKGKNNIEFLGRVSDVQKRWLFANCLAYFNPQEEDFGITAVEAMACGRPVIAYRAGGAKETIVEGETGEFFDEQWWEEIADKVIRFDDSKYNPEKIREHAKRFSTHIFKDRIKKFIAGLPHEENNF